MRLRAWRPGRRPLRSERTPEPGGTGLAKRLVERGVGLEARHDAATGQVERGPPGIVVIAEIEHIGGTGLDRHRLGGGDVIDIGRRHGVIDRPAGIWIVDDMGLGAADIGRKARPVGAGAGQMQAGRIDQAHLLAEPAAHPPVDLGQHVFEQAGERFATAVPVGIGKGRARRNLGPGMIEPCAVAGHGGFHRAQRMRALEWAEQQRRKMIAAGEAARPFVTAVIIHKPVERPPVNQLEKVVKHAILMMHGVGPFVSG